MSDNLKTGIYEMMQLIQDKTILQSDVKEMTTAMQKILTDKYINRFQTIINKQQKKLTENPSREIQLLRAMKPFINENIRDNMDNAISMWSMMETMRGLSDEMKIQSSSVEKTIVTASSDNSIHEDGIYDVDESCLISKKEHTPSPRNTHANLIMTMLALFLRI